MDVDKIDLLFALQRLIKRLGRVRCDSCITTESPIRTLLLVLVVALLEVNIYAVNILEVIASRQNALR